MINRNRTEQAEEIRSPLRAIRAKCLDCCGGSPNEAKLCTCQDCPLYAFRLGKNPYRQKHELTEEQRAKAVANLKKSRSGTDGKNV